MSIKSGYILELVSYYPLMSFNFENALYLVLSLKLKNWHKISFVTSKISDAPETALKRTSHPVVVTETRCLED